MESLTAQEYVERGCRESTLRFKIPACLRWDDEVDLIPRLYRDRLATRVSAAADRVQLELQLTSASDDVAGDREDLRGEPCNHTQPDPLTVQQNVYVHVQEVPILNPHLSLRLRVGRRSHRMAAPRAQQR